MRAPSWLAALVVAGLPVTALAQDPAAREPPGTDQPPAAGATVAPPPLGARSWREAVSLDGLADTYYSVRLGGTGAQPLAFHLFDNPQDTFSLAYAKVGLSVKHDPVGLRLDIGYGTIANIVNSPAIAPPQFSGANLVYQNVQQAYLSFSLPTVVPITVDVGKFVTFAGAEVIESHKNWSYSRSFLFNYAIPRTHTGLRLTVPVTGSLTLQAMAVNGWDLVYDNNRAKTFGASATWNAPTGTIFVLNGIAGVETPGASWRFLADVVISQALGNLSLMVNGDYGKEGSNRWYGAAAYVRYALLANLNLAARGEIFRDPQNFRLASMALPPGGGVTVESLTLTAGVPVGGIAELRAEVRGDFASEDIFVTDATGAIPDLASRQYQLLFAALAWF